MNYRELLRKRMRKDCYGNIILKSFSNRVCSVIYGGYGLQFRNRTNSALVTLCGNGRFVYDADSLVAPKYILDELQKIANEFASNEEFNEFMNGIL